MRRLAMITGAGRGIGRACALEFCRTGHAVALVGRDEARLARTAAECRQSGQEAHVVPLDLEDAAAVRVGVRRAEQEIGPIEVLVNNAGVDNSAPFLSITEEIWDRAMNVNLKGLFFCTQAAAEGMIERKQGVIVNISSILGLRPGQMPYAITKWGVEAFTKCLARELTPKGIRVNGVAPGVTATAMTGFKEGDPLERPGFPMGRVARPEEIARAARFLASEEAAYISGATLIVDGGWSASH